MMLIVLFFLCWSVASLEFHLDRQFPLCCMQGIAAITPLSNGGIVVEAANPSVTILNGDNFTNKLTELQADSSVSKIVVTPDGGVYFGNGDKIIHKITQNETNVTFSEGVLWSNMVLTDKYALVAQQSDSVPILKKLDLQKLKIETFTIEGEEKWYNYLMCLSDLKNGQIFFASRYTAYLLNNETFQIQQQFVETEPSRGAGFQSTSSYRSEQDFVILIQGRYTENYQTYRFNQDSRKFEYFNRFYGLTTSLTLTSPNTAVSIYKGKLLYWEDFDKQIVARSKDQSEHIGNWTWRTVALSNSQTFFAMKNLNLNEHSIRFVTFTLSNNFSVISTVQKSSGLLLSAKFSDDDAYLIYNQENNLTQVRRLYKLDVTTKQQTLMMDGDQPLNGLAFLPMGDRLIVFMNRTTADNITQNYIQLRDIATFSLISQLEVKINATPYDFKILGNKHWNSNFLVLIQSQQYSTEDSLAFKFRVVGDQIQLLLSEMQNIVFKNSFACNKYLINIPMNQNIQVYEVQAMSLIKNISNDFRYDNFFSQGDILVAEYFQVSGTSIFDFSSDINHFEKGLFFRQYYTSTSFDNFMIMLFAKRGLYVISNIGYYGGGYPIKLIYDLNKIPVRKFSPLPVSTVNGSVIIQSPINSSCLWVFIVSEKELLRHNTCDPTNLQVVSNIARYFLELSVSSNQKYLLLAYFAQPTSYYQYTIEVRLTSNIEVLVKLIPPLSYKQYFMSIDITNDQKMIVHLGNYLLVFDMEQQQNIANLDIESINLYDASRDIIAMTGKSKSDSNKSLLIIKKINDPQSLLSITQNSLPKIIKMSQSAARVAVYDSESKLSVWDIKSQIIIIESTFEGVIDMKFIDDTKILLQFSSIFSIISLQSLQTVKDHQIGLNFTKITPNSDGTLFAVLVNPTNVKVFDISMNQIANFITPPNNNIVDVGFSSNDEVYAVTSNGSFFILSPTPCPATFINVDSVCVCLQNRTDTGGTCQCSPNFVEQDNKCLCLNGFTFEGNSCFCNVNATVADGACTCKSNFIRQGDECLCANGFTFEGGNCYCNSNATVVEGECTCKLNFVRQRDECLCANGFTFEGSNCFCNSNATVVENTSNKSLMRTCTCKQNFTQRGSLCLCINGFTFEGFEGSNCFCNSNASVIQSICECRDNFVPIDNKCICGNEFSYVNGQCIECSFMCSSCDGSGAFDCTQYSAVFYVGIAGVCVIGVALIVIIVCIVKRRREKGSVLQSNLTDHKDNESNNQNSLGEQLFDGKQHK